MKAKFANVYFDAMRAEIEFECRLIEEFGFGQYAKMSGDDYDNSLEFYGVNPDARLSREALEFIWSEGFSRLWLNHTDDIETSYRANGKYQGWRKRKDYSEISEWPEAWPEEWRERYKVNPNL